MKKFFVLLSIVQLMALNAVAASRTNDEIARAAYFAINGTRKQSNAHHQGELKELHKTAGLTVMGYENGGFAVISNDDIMPDVLGVSDAQFSGLANPNFQWWLRAINEVCEASVAQGAAAAAVPTPDDLGFYPNVEPIVQAEWDQESPYSDMCPRNRSNRRCLTGCVATAIAQVLYTHKTPVYGNGSHTNYKSYSAYQNSNGSNEDVTFVYDGFVPDYDNMIDRYTSGPTAYQYTEAQAHAVAELMLACGVAVDMDYSTDGSGAYTDVAAQGLIQYLGITTADFKNRDDYSDTEWMTMVYEELAGGHAMYYSAVDTNPWLGGGHAFVCDGYDETGKVHINWGWSGSDNGYFNINLLNPGSYQFSEYQDFIRGLWDPNEATNVGIQYVNLKLEDVAAGSLADSIGADTLVALRSLTITGELNSEDLALIKKLASGEELTELGIEEGTGHLAILDLSDAVLPDNEIADNAFRDCVRLTSVRLPRQLERIGTYAFAGCSRLNRIQSYTYNVPKMGTRVFEGVSSTGVSLFLIAGSSEYYRRNAQWKSIVTSSNITEFGTCLKARNKIREYGEANPVFGFQLTGERVIGTPHIWTDATIESEPGKYTIYIEAGTLEDTKNVVFVNGVLTIKEPTPEGISEVKADAKAAAEYSVGGILMKDNSQRGFYISNGKKIVR